MTEEEPIKATREVMESLSVGDEVTINRTGKHLNGGTYTITEDAGNGSYKITDERGREGVMVQAYGGQYRIHIKNGTRQDFTWIGIE